MGFNKSAGGHSRMIDKVCYVSRARSTSHDLSGSEIKDVLETFAYNPESKTVPKTAERWASQSHYYTPKRGKQHVPIVETRDNVPFEVTITDLDVRTEGGRAYKVMDSERRLFDMREDQIMDAIHKFGILPGGRVPVPVVWGIAGSTLKLAIVGGTLYEEMLKNAKDLEVEKASRSAGMLPSESTFKVGFIYSKKDSKQMMFLGFAQLAPDAKKYSVFIAMPEKMLAERSGSSKEWDRLSWSQRCTREWVEGTWRCPGVSFMSSPKFLSEAQTGAEPAFAESIRSGVGTKHPIVNGMDLDLAEKQYEVEIGRKRDSERYNHGYGNDYNKWCERIQRERKEYAVSFAKKVVWL